MSEHEEIVGKGISDAIGGEMAEEKEVPKKLSRKEFVKGAAVGGAGVAAAGVLASCAPAATPTTAPEAAPTCPPAEECPPCPTPAAAGEAGETLYAVYAPYGHPTREPLNPVARLDTLEGKTICGIFGGSFHFPDTFPVIADLLKEKYPTAKFVGPEEFGTDTTIIQDPEKLGPLLEQYGCDAVISGNGC